LGLPLAIYQVAGSDGIRGSRVRFSGRLDTSSGLVGVTFTRRLGYPKPILAEQVCCERHSLLF
jgi:hypothetical protein